MMPFRSRPFGTPTLRLGTYTQAFFPRDFILSPHEVQRHTHYIGKSGSGKSTALASIIVQLINQGIGTSLVDPQGDLAVLVMRILAQQGYFKREEDYERILYVDFSHPTNVPPMNVLNQPRYPPDEVASALADVCLRVWPSLEGVGVTFLNIIKHAALALTLTGQPVTTMQEFLEKPEYRAAILAQVDEPQVLRFFANRYDMWKDQTDKRDSTLNRVDLFTFSPRMRAILGHTTNLLDYRDLMDRGVSVIYNLGGLDGERRKFMGAFIAYGYEKAASSRADILEDERRLHMLFMDEFALFSAQTSQALEEILSGARKYKLFLGLAHQNFGQTDTRLKQALQNAETFAFKLNRDDAVWMAPRLVHFNAHEVKHEVEDKGAQERTHPVFTSIPEQFEKKSRELEDLPVGHCYVKFGSTVKRIVTTPLPKPTIALSELSEITEEYARRLLVPIKEPMADHSPTSVPVFAQTSLRRRVLKNGSKQEDTS